MPSPSLFYTIKQARRGLNGKHRMLLFVCIKTSPKGSMNYSNRLHVACALLPSSAKCEEQTLLSLCFHAPLPPRPVLILKHRHHHHHRHPFAFQAPPMKAGPPCEFASPRPSLQMNGKRGGAENLPARFSPLFSPVTFFSSFVHPDWLPLPSAWLAIGCRRLPPSTWTNFLTEVSSAHDPLHVRRKVGSSASKVKLRAGGLLEDACLLTAGCFPPVNWRRKSQKVAGVLIPRPCKLTPK